MAYVRAKRFNCAICQDFSTDSRDDYFVSTRCGHIFHHSCIQCVIGRYGICPLCGKTTSLNTLIRLHGIEAPIREDSPMELTSILCDHVFKIAVLGDTGVGKSALLKRFAENKFYEDNATVGCDVRFKALRMGDKTVKLNLWDTAGTERYRSVTPSYVRQVQAIFLVYSITDITTFNNIQDWMDFASRYGPENAVRVLIGNKSDQEELRMVRKQRGKELSESKGIRFFETSAREDTNNGVKTAFRITTAEILQNPDLVRAADTATTISRRMIQSNNVLEASTEADANKGCCKCRSS